jgi:biphenyl 2,3-dioxygenase beta subunit
VVSQIDKKIERQFRVEQFLYEEANLLDSWEWAKWFELFAEDLRYWMPLRRNLQRRERGTGQLPTGLEMALIDDDHTQLKMRVQQMASGRHWAEDPPSRCRHVISNIVVLDVDEAKDELLVRSNFIVYRNRLEREVDIWAGSREDKLRTSGDSFQIAARTVLLDQNVVLSKNLSVFF